MEIVVLDGYALNPGDLSWDELAQLGSLTVYDRTAPEDVRKRAEGAEILLTNKTVLTGKTLQQLPKLKFISVLATGYNIVDIEAAAALRIPVSNVPAYSTMSVAQLTFALILELCHGVAQHSHWVHDGNWCASPDYSHWVQPLTELAGKTLGIVGFGAIGQQVAAIGNAFGMKIRAYNPSARPAPQLPDFAFVSLDELYAQADFITLHCPQKADNLGMIDAAALRRMKPSAYLINTARGGLIDEQALADALNSGALAGAALDVLSSEPPERSNPLLSAKNVFFTPHIAWATFEARQRLMATTVENVRAYLAGQPIHLVNAAWMQ